MGSRLAASMFVVEKLHTGSLLFCVIASYAETRSDWRGGFSLCSTHPLIQRGGLESGTAGSGGGFFAMLDPPPDPAVPDSSPPRHYKIEGAIGRMRVWSTRLGHFDTNSGGNRVQTGY